ncbi:hypothetical protein [Dactylosporangium sp. CA-092794]|uniref:hypothetical protein n=1 Tax=Dactylosporangium sp. CA-092794 TaxID=3239929 RepID=UPI003D902A17
MGYSPCLEAAAAAGSGESVVAGLFRQRGDGSDVRMMEGRTVNRSRRVLTGLALSAALVASIVLTAPTAASASTCSTWYPMPAGSYICEYTVTYVGWPDNHGQYFLVGTNDHIYDSYQSIPGNNSSWTSWRDLGGIGRSSVTINTGQQLNSADPLVFLNYYSDWIALKVLGTTGLYYCKAWTASGGWQPSLTTWTTC